MRATLGLYGRLFRFVSLVAILGTLSGCGAVGPGATTPTPNQSAAAPPTAGAGVTDKAGLAQSATGSLAAAAAVPSRGIVVNGTGSVSARPDRAIVSAGVQSRAVTAQEAHDAN